ncbi:hypothetical protein LGK95_22085 [Clostridium algoriphilum]|uniref:hypothetical protein n=1 Tax=Clostridium algoriphilum TaxID=198347 RepID=UPI001CF127C9|nr:hypothetical protein [Clostridium algoriphilum]MCB2296139.1 hypothetical protein [Clostridium algoriphilum]
MFFFEYCTNVQIRIEIFFIKFVIYHFITIVCREKGCGECGTIERKLVFVLPDDITCDPEELDVRVAANYIYPCEDK